MLSNIPRATEVDERFPGQKELLDTPENINKPIPKPEGVIRVWVDGCFDMLHFGHANALRQAALLGHELYVGIHTDEEVMRFKGPPIMHDYERYAAARACKWVSRVIEGVPYVTDVADIEKYDIDFVVHGDDMSTDLNGNNSYQAIIDIGKFKIVKRTEGISTTDLVGRMLLLTTQHHQDDDEGSDPISKPVEAPLHKGTSYSSYITSSRKVVQFSNDRAPPAGGKIVYVDGGFDLFHCGHAALLKKARECGDYLIVGLHTDKVINDQYGANYPIMNINERMLGVLSCRHADEVIMGVPYEVTKQLIDQLNVSIVVEGSIGDRADHCAENTEHYRVPKEMSIHKAVTSDSKLTTQRVIERVIEHRMAFEERQRKKIPKDEKVASQNKNNDIQEM
eukprot:TRINITY_DN24952_c0_g1_i1.p1 TRINITY_DN24952_c0_g1~~TRINITY_DN24952_c0_g1_i1.p1  ORF type:complete len:410 (+),score=195.34 TRINITY_DN24952_c0_g1_i1:51-1232(+)